MSTDKQKMKSAVTALVNRKVGLTAERQKFKYESRGTVPEMERVSWFHGKDMERAMARSEIRYSLLAYAFVRGMPYQRVEAKTERSPLAHVIVQAAQHAGVVVDLDTVTAWLSVLLIPKGFEQVMLPDLIAPGLPDPSTPVVAE